MKNRVITISREFGRDGRTIGKRVAEKLGIPLKMDTKIGEDGRASIHDYADLYEPTADYGQYSAAQG